MTDNSPGRLANALLMVVVGVPSLTACLFGGAAFLGVLFVGSNPSEALPGLLIGLGGLAGLWGSQAVSTGAGTPLAKAASAMGVISFSVLAVLVMD